MADTVLPIPAGIHVRYVDHIAILVWNSGENRLNLNSVNSLHEALDQIERNESVKAMILTGVGKYFSCGLDLDWLRLQDSSMVDTFLSAYNKLTRRILVFPMPVIAAINGHAYAAGAIIAMYCDYRIMRSQRGWICLPEINIRIPLQPRMIEVLSMKLPDSIICRDMMLFGKRLTGEEAKDRGVVDDCVDAEALIVTSLAFTKKLTGAKGFDRATMHQMKENMYGYKLDQRATVDNSAGHKQFKVVLKSGL